MSRSMLDIAKEARDRAYAPYSTFHVGCCIRTTNNQFYSGCNIENASYGLTLCAEGAAIAAMITGGEQQIAEVVIISNGADICTPCGACRQRLREFAPPDILVHMSNRDGKQQICSLESLLPYSFGPAHLEHAIT